MQASRILTLFFILNFSILSPGYGHDLKLAIFEISETDRGYEMFVSADRLFLLECIHSAYPSSNDSYENLLLDYLQCTVGVYINGEHAAFKLKEVEYGNDNIVLLVQLTTQLQHISEIQLQNSFMTERIDGHENIMKLRINDRMRSFRLNKSRTTTIANYDPN